MRSWIANAGSRCLLSSATEKGLHGFIGSRCETWETGRNRILHVTFKFPGNGIGEQTAGPCFFYSDITIFRWKDTEKNATWSGSWTVRDLGGGCRCNYPGWSPHEGEFKSLGRVRFEEIRGRKSCLLLNVGALFENIDIGSFDVAVFFQDSNEMRLRRKEWKINQ